MKNNNTIFKQGSKTFYTASLFFPKDVRINVERLYAYVRTADDYVDALPQNKKGFLQFKRMTEHSFNSVRVSNSIIRDFVSLCHEYSIEKELVDSFLWAMEQDLTKKKYTSYKELELYMYGSAEVIGLMMARILHLPREAEPAARLQGKAMQLINFIRDIKEDTTLGRQYIPQNDLGKFGIYRLSDGIDEGKFKKLIQFEIGRYKKLQAAARKGYPLIPKATRIPIATAASLYEWTATEIIKNPMIVFSQKVKPKRIRILLEYVKLSCSI